MKKYFKFLILLTLCMTISIVLASCADSASVKQEQNISFHIDKEGVDAFYDLLQTKADVSPLLKKENCYNVTTQDIKDLGIEIFKFSDQCEAFITYKDDIYFFAPGWGGYGFVNAVVCDYDNNGTKDILYTYSYGSGIHRSEIALLDLTTCQYTVLLSTFNQEQFPNHYMADLVLEKRIENGNEIYEAFDAHLFFSNKGEASYLVQQVKKKEKLKTIEFSNYKEYIFVSAKMMLKESNNNASNSNAA